MALRIACDLDGTLADLDAALQREARALFGDAARIADLTERQTSELWSHVGEIEDFWLSLAECEPGAVARLAGLATMNGWEVLFLTQRPATAGETAQVQSQRWLEAHGFDLPSVYVMKGSRGKVADALGLDVLIDDRPENCLDVVTDSKARAFLIWRDEPAAIPAAAMRLGIEPALSLAEIFERLQQMHAGATRSSGFVGRLRSAIGI